MESHKDLAGNPVEVGSYVVYAALWNRSATLKYGKVLRLAERKSYGDESPTPTVRIRSIDRNYDNSWSLQNQGKKTTLGFVDRMLVISSEMLPQEAINLLEMPAPKKHSCDYPCNICSGKK